MSDATDPTAAFTLGPAASKTDTAVLLLHGFTGSPWELRLLGDALAARGFHAHAPLLPGHGTRPESMLWVTWRDWEDAAVKAFHSLFRFKRLVVVGLSMGGLLSLILSGRYPERVSGLVLMAPVVKLRQLDGRVLRLLRDLPFEGLKQRWLSKSGSDIEDPEQRLAAPLLPRYPAGRLFDLFTLQDLAQAAVPRVDAKALIVAAVNDHVVALEGVEQLHRALPRSRLLMLQRGFHILPRDRDRALLFTEIAEFIDRL